MLGRAWGIQAPAVFSFGRFGEQSAAPTQPYQAGSNQFDRATGDYITGRNADRNDVAVRDARTYLGFME